MLVIAVTCKKRPDEIRIVLYDPLLDQPIAGAELSLIEFSYSGGVFSSSSKCEVVTTAITNSNGEGIFTKAKLRNNSEYNYFIAVSNVYNNVVHYSCANHPSDDYLKKSNNSISKTIYYHLDLAKYKLVISGIANSFATHLSDSISFSLFRNFPLIEGFNSPLNGDKSKYGGTLGYNKTIYDKFPTPPDQFAGNPHEIIPGKYKAVFYKRKNTIEYFDTIQFLIKPFEETILSYAW